jgi:NitT/TauT family transport system permease protein
MTLRDLRTALYPLAGIAIIVAVWQLYVSVFCISRIVLPGPLDILNASIASWPLLLKESWPTFLESVLGFALAVAFGVPVAVCVANSRVLNLTLTRS